MKTVVPFKAGQLEDVIVGIDRQMEQFDQEIAQRNDRKAQLQAAKENLQNFLAGRTTTSNGANEPQLDEETQTVVLPVKSRRLARATGRRRSSRQAC